MEEKEEKKTDHTGKDEGAVSEEHKKKKKKDEVKKDGVIEELSKSLQEKEETIKTLQEKLLYFQAEFENFKKLKNKEKLDTLKFGNEVLIKDLLPVIDNLERALEHASKTEDFKSIHEGIEIVLNEFLKVLERAGVEPVEALGKKFDPNFHEAFLQEERDDMKPETVISEHQKGYVLNGRLIRPSMVSISTNSEKH
ncbi:MAG: nucleotide exchange factor GrpE [Proteobacteria bacterium]|nr:nucleotide exchange factor GrpE [Pseudomonadota bacterium]